MMAVLAPFDRKLDVPGKSNGPMAGLPPAPVYPWIIFFPPKLSALLGGAGACGCCGVTPPVVGVVSGAGVVAPLGMLLAFVGVGFVGLAGWQVPDPGAVPVAVAVPGVVGVPVVVPI